MEWLLSAAVLTFVWVALKPAAVRTMKQSLIIVPVLGRQTLIYVPDGADGTKIIVYFMGHDDSASARGPKLIEGMRKANQKAVLIIPQLQGKSDLGDLSTRFNEWLVKSRQYLEVNTTAEIAIISHSGGYRATASAINQVSYINKVALLDSLYGNIEDFYQFALRLSTKRFIDIYGPTTKTNSVLLKGRLKNRSNVLFEETTIPHNSIPQSVIARVVDLLF